MDEPKEHPIIFSGEMVRAILEDKKTQTRRIVKGKWIPLVEEVLKVNGHWVFETVDYDLTTPYGLPRDRLWVRETFMPGRIKSSPLIYKADLDEMILPLYSGGWKSSIHMPRLASRITLIIEAIRVERLQDISVEDVEKEGFHRDVENIQRFENLWDSINAKRGSWESNPWVWVIGFRRYVPQEEPSGGSAAF